MRKTLILISFFGVTNAYCQSGVPAKQLSVEEANKMNGTASPTINGIPYNQYKAQQATLKQDNTIAPVNTSTVASGATGKGVQAPASKVSSAKVSATDNPAPAKNQSASAAIPTATTAVPAAKTAVTQTDVQVQSPATQVIPTQTLKSSAVNDKQVPTTTTSVKPVVVEGKQINGGALVAIPTLTLAPGNDTQTVVATPQVKQAEQVSGQPKAAVVVETPPSVASPAPKSPKQN